MKKDPRIGHIIKQIVNFSKGNFDRYIKVSDKVDEIDGISAGLNALGEILNKRVTSFPQVEIGDSENIQASSPPPSRVFNTNAKNGKHVNTRNQQFDAELFSAIYQNAPHPIVVMNSRQCVLEWNPAAQRIFGWSDEEVKGKFLFEFLVPEHFRAAHNVGVQKIFKKNNKAIESTRSFRFPARCKSSDEIEVKIIVTPVRLSERDFFIGFINECTRSSVLDARKSD